jgi:hypothetical protein
MSRARLMLLSLVAVLSVGAMLASSASAVINFEWKVNGVKLEAGANRTFTVKADNTFDLNGSVGGQAALLLATSVSVLPGAIIKGGKPGTNLEIILFGGVTVDRPAKCAVSGGLVLTVPLKTEIVEGAKNKEGNGEVDILFAPETAEGGGSTLFTAFELINKGTEECIVKGTLATASGTVLNSVLPAKTEALTGLLHSEAPTKEYKNSAGAFKTAGLLFANNPATLQGLTLVTLTSDEKFGAF